MLHSRRGFLVSAAALNTIPALSGSPGPAPQDPPAQPAPGAPALTQAQKEEFLLKADIIKAKGSKKGITGTTRATLSNGTLTHDCSIQTLDDFKQSYQTSMGTEFNFKDSWKFNVAAYRLDRMLGLNMVPVTVERHYQSRPGSFTWWIEDVQFDEGERERKKIKPPNLDEYNNQMYIVRVFDQLIFNVDRNLQNLLIDKEWRLWMIDHSRSFRNHDTLKEQKNLVMCDKDLLEQLKKLEAGPVKEQLGRYCTSQELGGLLKRRDKIVAIFEKKGPSALYSIGRRPA